jgi:SAM-dependent methyltransferase
VKDEEQACRICCSADLKCIEAFGSMPRVTSDCVPFKRGGKLAVCVRCGTAQALADEQWFAEIAEIYGKYDIYNQSRGVEQHVFDPVGGSLRPRSEVILERLSEGSNIPLCGKVLDVGCGTGGTLRAFAGHGKWTSYALELDDRNLASLEAIRGFRTLYNCTPAQVPEQFDIITLIHSLEHFPDPYSTLVDLLGKLHHEGSLFIEVPNAADNPFDYMVADHRVHFTKETLTYLVQRSGFSVQLVATDWVSKEISLVAVRSSGTELRVDLPTRNSHLDVIEQVDWLKDFIDCARKAAAGPAPFGLFGTAIAATWLWPAVSERVQFFVEEDPNRIGRTHMGRPILSPAQAPSGAVVFLALVPSIASSIRERLKYLPIDFRTPPRMP